MYVKFPKALLTALFLGCAVQVTTAQSPVRSFDAASFERSFTHHMAVVGGVRMHYVIGGTGDPLVLLHGLPATWYEWRFVMPLLAERYTVIAPDLRGIGNSSKPAGGYDTRTVAEGIHQLVLSLGYSSVSVAGHDWGAAVAFAYAAHYRDEVRRLAILDMPIPGYGYEEAMQVTPQGGLWHLGFQMTPDIPEMLVTGKERQYFSVFYRGASGSGDDPNAVTPDEIDEYMRHYTMPGGLRAYFAYYQAAFQDSDQNRAAAKVKLPMPLLALGGERSMGANVVGKLRDAAVDVRVAVVPRAGHWVLHDNPVFVADQLRAFFP